MPLIHVAASTEYDVNIERGTLDAAGELISAALGKSGKCGSAGSSGSALNMGTAAVISDETVFALYGERVLN